MMIMSKKLDGGGVIRGIIPLVSQWKGNKKMFKKTESGRSIVEMLGVLAIMGVITVMGISGYSQAVARINRNKMVEDITRLAQEVRTLYAGRNTYANIKESDVYSIMGAPNPYPNPFGGRYYVGKSDASTQFFCVSSTNISYQDCLYFYNMQWLDSRDGDGKSNSGYPLVKKGDTVSSGTSDITAPTENCESNTAAHSIVLCYQ